MKRLACAFVVCLAGAFGQTVTGNLDGHLTDPAGSVIPGVEVVAHGTGTGVERTTSTNQDG